MSTPKTFKMSLKWEKFDVALSQGLCELLNNVDLVDVTLACQGQFVKAHKNILSVCSPYFRAIFKETPSQHPVVVLQGAKISHVHSLLQFMYTGETTIPQGELATFLRTAETLQIKGLMDEENEVESSSRKRKRLNVSASSAHADEPELCTIETPEGPISAEFFQFGQSKVSDDDTSETDQTERFHWAEADVSVVSSNDQKPAELEFFSGLRTAQASTVNIADLIGRLLTMDPNSSEYAETVTQVRHKLQAGRLAKQGINLPPEALEQLRNIDPALAADADQLSRMEELCAGSGLYIDRMTKELLIEKHGLSPYDLFRKLLIHFIPREKLCRMTATGRTNSLHTYAGETEKVPAHVLCGLALFMKQYMIENEQALENIPSRKMLDLKYINDTVGKIASNLRKGIVKQKPENKKKEVSPGTLSKKKLSSKKTPKKVKSEHEEALLAICSGEPQGEVVIVAQDECAEAPEASTSQLPDSS